MEAEKVSRPRRVYAAASRTTRHGLTRSLTHIVIGTLKGYDQLMNLVLDDVKETMRGTV